MTTITMAVILVGYFLPTLVAGLNRHRNASAICALNLLLGWTLIGWVVALVWALTDGKRDDGGPIRLSR